ncbi:MAG: phosphatidylinositol-specific phospholipase C [Pseudonocardiales bacterium]|nr:phosphatidylinositol-specific phospholipase C [Pseudonocardiales bacterium]
MDEFISRTSWMRDIPDEIPVTALSIPGTHNSGCIGGLFGFGQTQNLDLADQLNAGIRFLDIRLAHYQEDLVIHHDVVCMHKSYTDVLAISSRFLRKHPSETILMSVKDEGRLDDRLDRFAPSKILGRLPRGDTAETQRNASSFEDILKARTLGHIENAPSFYNFATRPSGDDSMASGRAFTSETNLGEVRGKIVLLRRFDGSSDVGLDLTYWPENQTFRSAEPPVHDVHDRYRGLRDEDKYELIIAHLEEAKRGELKDLYITFSSAIDLKARGYAKTINPRLNDYLTQSPKGRVGIVVMDYFEEPRELVSNVIKMN